MDTFILLLVIIMWGLYLLIVLSFFIYRIYKMFKEEDIYNLFAGILWLLLFGSFPAWGFYITMNKYYSKPKPTIVMETCKDGETCMMYQDTTHLCHPSDNNSTVFTSYMPPNGAVSQMDTYIICLRPFLVHDTHAEHGFFDAMSEGTEAYYNSLNVDLLKKTNIQVNSVMTCRDSGVFTPQEAYCSLNFFYFCFSRFNYNFTHNNY